MTKPVCSSRETWFNLRNTLAVNDPYQQTVLIGQAALFADMWKLSIREDDNPLELPFVPRAVEVLCDESYIKGLRRRHKGSGTGSTVLQYKPIPRGHEVVVPGKVPYRLDFIARTVLKTPDGSLSLNDCETQRLIDDSDIPSLALKPLLGWEAARSKTREVVCAVTPIALAEALLSEEEAREVLGIVPLQRYVPLLTAAS